MTYNAHFPARIPAAMPTFTLPDGSEKRFSTAVDGLTIAAAIGQRLAKDAVAIEVNGQLRDLGRPLEQDAAVAIVTRD